MMGVAWQADADASGAKGSEETIPVASFGFKDGFGYIIPEEFLLYLIKYPKKDTISYLCQVLPSSGHQFFLLLTTYLEDSVKLQ